MKNVWFLFALMFFLNMGVSPAQNHPKEAAANSNFQGAEQNPMVLAQAKASPVEQENEKYQQKIQDALKDYKEKMKQLQSKAKNLNEKAKAEVKEGMEDLQKKMDAAEQKLKSIRTASGEAWEKLKTEVDAAMDSVKDAYKKIAARFE